MDAPQSPHEPNVLYYWDKSPGQGGRPVPMSELFPLFANSNETLAQSPRLCRSDYEPQRQCRELQQAANMPLLDECTVSKCLSELEALPRNGATVDHLFAASGTETPDPEAQVVVGKFFNSAGALEECKIRHCPSEFFNARSFHCLPLFGPYLYDRKMYIRRPQADGSGDAAWLHKAYLATLRNQSVSIESIRKHMAEESASEPALHLGICVPTLPLNHVCDGSGVDPTTGALVLPTREDMPPTLGTWNPLWLHKMDHLRPINRHFDRDDANVDARVRLLLTTPANTYTLAHCPASTGRVAASKLGGQACSASIECVFGLCVNGKCSEAALGKQLDPAKAAEIALDTWSRIQDRMDRREGNKWTTIAAGVLGGLLVLRVLREVYVRWTAARVKKEASARQ